MVFESIVADLLNRCLGDYVENLDRSQLKIGIWGGDVVLQDLSLKQSALDELDLPVRTVYGHLGKLVLKIPWKNLYSAPVEASIESLFLLVVPNQSLKYDPVKEEKYQQDVKQTELQRVENAKKSEKEKDQPKVPDTFVEKLATQIIKNVQVKIQNIHVRYEDTVTNPGQPFSLGITLHNLSVHTTDENWEACIANEAATMIHKVLELEGLAVYWNCRTKFFPIDQPQELPKIFKESICTKNCLPEGFLYMLGPISSSAYLRLNPKPENDDSNFKIPKVLFNLTLERLAVGISKDQYHDLIELLESVDRMSRAALYRKYRPEVPCSSHAKEWWKFAYMCVLEEDVRRKRRNWDWQHMARHRALLREYAIAYQTKLTVQKLAPEVLDKLTQCEKILDVFNIILVRQKIEMEVERLEAKQQETKQKRGWFSGWFGGSSPVQKEAMSAAAIVKQFEDAMTNDEKGKLYRAIGYQENAAPTQYPATFVEMVLNFTLKSLAIEVRDDSYDIPRILYTELQGVVSSIEQRPSAQAMKVVVKINAFTVFGLTQGTLVPKLVSSKELKEGVLLDVLFETNPLDGKCDQRLHVSSRPVQIVYDAQTINKVIDVFRAPRSNALSQLQAAAESRLTNFKEMSAMGLQYAIEQQKVLELKVNLSASYILIPHSGCYHRKEDVLVVNLGNFSMVSVPCDPSQKVNVRQLFSQGTSEDDIMKIMKSQSYQKFMIELKDMQVLVALSGEDWKTALVMKKVSPMHLLLPTSLKVNFEKCLIIDDPHLPKVKVLVNLPNISINLEDERLMHLLMLLLSIPFSNEPELEMNPMLDSSSRASSLSILSRHVDIALDRRKLREKSAAKIADPNLVQATELQLDFEMEEMTMAIFRHGQDGSAERLLYFRILRLELEMQQQTFDMTVTMRLGGIAMTQSYRRKDIKILDTPMAAGELEYMFIVKYINVDKKSPEFHSKHGSVEKLVLVDFTRLSVLLHQEALVHLLEYVTSFSSQLEEVTHKKTTSPDKAPSTRLRPALNTILEEGGSSSDLQKIKVCRKRSTRKLVTESIDLKLKATVHKFNVELTNQKLSLATLSLEGVALAVTMKKSCTEVIARLRNIILLDPNPMTCHEKILSIMDDEAMSAEVVMFNLDEHSSPDSVDISVKAEMACIRIVFLNWFVTTLLTFLNSFQRAQQMIVDAAAEAAEAARQNVQTAYAKATRMSLAIDIKAPLIVIPVNSKSMNAIFLDLGNLMIKNKFETLKIYSDTGHPAVIDVIQLELQNLKLSRVKLGDEGELINECMLLQPISFTLKVKRNLSTGWYQQIPDIDMSGRLKEVKVTLSQEDYRMVMRVTSENLAEGAKMPVDVVQSSHPDWTKSSHFLPDRPNTLEGLQTITVASVDNLKQTVTPKAQQVTTSMKFTFTMDSLIIDLFIGGSKNLKGISSPMHLSENGLARFSLHVLSLKGRLYSDGTLSTSVVLVDCLLDDTRQGRENKLTRLMERKLDSCSCGSLVDQNSQEQTYRSMVDVTYQQKGSDMFVDVRIFGFNLILCLDYLKKVADFFTAAPEVEAPEVQAPEVQAPARKMSISTLKPSRMIVRGTTSTISRLSTTTSRAKIAAVVKEEPVESMMTVNIRVEKPDIILVENMDDINTNAIVLNNEVIFKLRMSNDHQVMTGSIKDLQLYSCCYNPKKRSDTISQILLPCSISLAGSTPPGEGLHLDLCLTDIRLRVSPPTIELLSNVQRTLVVSQDDIDESTTKEEDYSDIWQAQKFIDTDYWYLKTEVGDEAISVVDDTAVAPVVLGEICLVSAPSIVITVEAGVGNQTLPMILLEVNFQGAVNNWSTQLYIDSSLSIQMAYYNSVLALWEPLIEPVETLREGVIVRSPWELRAEIQMNKQEETVGSPVSTAEDVEDIPYQPPAMTIDVSSKDNLELTMTKTCIDVLGALGKAFQTAFKEGLAARVGPVAPYLVQNDTGLAIALLLEKGPFQVQDRSENKEDYSQVMLESGAKVGLCVEEEDSVVNFKTTATQDQVHERFLQIKVIERNCTLELPVARADKRYFLLKHRGEGNDPWGLVSHVQVKDGGTIITLRSILQVHNHFNEPVDVYYMTKRGNEVECIGTVASKEQINLPLYSVYTPTNELFFSVQGFTVSVVPFVWKELQNQLATTKMLQCEPKDSTKKEPFFMKIVGELEQVYFEKTTRHTMVSTCYNIHLRPAVVLKNFLPIDLVCCLFGTAVETSLEAGKCIQIPTAEPSNSSIVLRISDYLDKEWSCKHEVQTNAPEFAVWTFDSHDSVHKVSLDLGMHTLIKNGSIIMSLYCPFWMLNKTGMMLSYRKSRKTEKNESSGSPMKRWASNLSLTGKPTVQSDDTANILYHPEDFKGPILFSFRAKSFFGKKKACVKIEDGEWSDKFSLDVAGSSGVVNCKSAGTVHKVGVHIQLTYSTLTKQVTFTPFYVIMNNSHYTIECQESDRPADPWTQVQPGSCNALWPQSSEDKHLHVRVLGTSEMTAPFSYGTVHTTLLRLDNKYGGVNVDVQMTEGAVYITFTSYEPGLAPALIMNHTNIAIPFSEKGSSNTWMLEPSHSLMYTWANPLGPRHLIWASHKKKDIVDDLRKDGIGQYSPQADVNMYWVSFLNGMQRVILFTNDMEIARDAQSAGELETLQQEITVSIYGVGLSLVNNLTRTELLYIGIASSGVIWEVRKTNHKRFKPLSVADCKAVEEAYERYNMEILIGNTPKALVHVDNKIEVDFENEEMIKPNKRRLRRTFQTGLWFQMKTSPHQLQLHAKVNRLQIDNQMYDCVFPVILAPVPPPKSVAADSALKPFAELSVVQRIMEHSPVQQYKYFKVLIQEFHVKVDIGFVNALLQMFEAEETSDEDEAQQFAEDRKLVDQPLLAHVSLQSSQEQKNFYDLLHFSPLKIHLSFSLSGGNQGLKAGQDTPHFLSVLLQSLGVTLTDIHDVVFKLAYFERQYSFLTQRQLMSEATMHYVGQSLKQLYVLVLGLDVLGNPYGLVLGLTQGVEDLFYEPFQGAIQGPGEFAEGLVLGVRSLFGHTVGGAAGAVSRITGAMGKGIAALTFDKDYQRKRREAMNQRPANVQMGLAQSGKGLVMGVVDGVSGVFLKPISGAREEGVEGFFKGMGKGVVGLVTRPTAGVIDFASGSFDAVKRAADLSDEITRLRPPRFFQQDGLVRPYVRIEANGNKILQELDKGRYASTDVYVFHMEPVAGGKDVLLLTDKRVMYIVHNDIFGGWQVDWDYTWEALSVAPSVVEKGIFITTGEPRKKMLGLFGSGEKSGKVVLIKDQEQKQWIANKMAQLMKH